MIMYIETFKLMLMISKSTIKGTLSDVNVFICNIIMYLTSQWLIIFCITVSQMMLKIYLSKIKGKIYCKFNENHRFLTNKTFVHSFHNKQRHSMYTSHSIRTVVSFKKKFAHSFLNKHSFYTHHGQPEQ